MGYNKFKLSDIIPNAWFFKLRDMSAAAKPPSKPPSKLKNRSLPPPSSLPSSEPNQCHARKSYHFARDLADLDLVPQDPPPPMSPPRKSKAKKHLATRKNLTANHHRRQDFSLSSSASTTCTCRTTTTTTTTSSTTTTEDFSSLSEKPEGFDIVIDVSKSYGFDFELPRIATKPNEQAKPTEKVSHKGSQSPPPSRRLSASSVVGVRLKVNSPRIMGRKQGHNGNLNGRRKSVCSSSSSSTATWRKRRSVSESFAVVKSSRDPQRDFRESMMEMIVENNLKGSKELEDLLACYLSLNPDEYHDVIIKVFKQIWFDLIYLRPH